MNEVVPWIAIASILVTVSIFLSQVIFRTGKLTSKVEALEALNLGEKVVIVKELQDWRLRVRDDMHEISEVLGGIKEDIKELKTLMEERTERRSEKRT